jgi:two-component system, sensor histidine kinase ChiS
MKQYQFPIAKMTIYLEVIVYALPVTLFMYFVLITGDFFSNLNVFLRASLVGAIVTFFGGTLIRWLRLRKVFVILNDTNKITEEEFSKIKLRLLLQPKFEAISVFIRYPVGVVISIVLIIYDINILRILLSCIGVVMITPISAVFFLFQTEIVLSKYLKDSRLAKVEIKKDAYEPLHLFPKIIFLLISIMLPPLLILTTFIALINLNLLRLNNIFIHFVFLASFMLVTCVIIAYFFVKSSKENISIMEKTLEMDKIKSNFFANVSHEIRTPLTLILSPVESALQGDYKKGVDEQFLQNIQRNAIRLLKLINNLLDFSKIEAGKMNLRIKEIDIVQIIHNYIRIVQPTADSKGVTVNVVSVKDSMTLFMDIEKFDKIAMNVFSNALKFTERGGTIEIRIKDDESNCYMEVKDTGIGIPTDKLETIFDRFSQVDISSTRKYEGTGIGLSLAKELIELSGGSISVTSRYTKNHPDDHGTVFTITFPKGKEYLDGRNDVEFINDEVLDDAITDQRRFIGVREMVDLKEYYTTCVDEEIKNETTCLHDKNKTQLHILVVEDNSDMRNFLTTLLENYYTVQCAVDGKDGFDKINELKPDLIITDVMMPNIDGYTMTKMIKEDSKLKRIPVLMLTAKADIAHKIEGLEYGADDYLTKPFNSKELLVRIKTLLKTREYEKIIVARNEEIENELQTARLLQQKLLPEVIPEISGYKSHVVYIPMDQVGGDFYDFKANDDVIELFIADVSGHGLHAAFISMITKMAFESIHDRKSTRNVLYILNDIICRSTVLSNYVTVFYCIINRAMNTISYSNAGHPPPLIYRQTSDEFLELAAHGPPLGISKKIELEEVQVQLIKGDRVCLFTDGITECRDPERNLFGDDGFMNFIRSNSKLSPNKFTETLLSNLRSFSCCEKFDDDLCLIVVDVL